MQRSANKLDYKPIYKNNNLSTQCPNHWNIKMSNSVPIKDWMSPQTSQIHYVHQSSKVTLCLPVFQSDPIVIMCFTIAKKTLTTTICLSGNRLAYSTL